LPQEYGFDMKISRRLNEMHTIKIGKTNLKVSRIGLGTLDFGHPTKGIQDKKEIYDCLNFALDNGIQRNIPMV